MNRLLELRAEVDSKTQLILQFVGFILIVGVWWSLSLYMNNDSILPSPKQVIVSYGELHVKDYLIKNLLYSLKLNVLGYFEAVLFAIPIGFIIGLFPIFKGMMSKYIDAIRYIPLTAVTCLFIAWFGIDMDMKVQFLAFGIFVYLLPVVVQRIYEVEDVYVQTAYTLGASKWQTIKKVFIPHVLAKISDDTRVLVAISWTYIIVAEMVNANGGVGALIYKAQRQSRIDKEFAILFLIILVGILQDKIFIYLDKKIFKHKHITKVKS